MLDSNRLQQLQQAPLWDFALSFYARPSIEQACLILQDQANVDVCELLLHVWLYQHGLQAAPAAWRAVRQERSAWQQRVTAVLRALRRDLKPQAATSDTITRLRSTVQQAELQAERENLQRWQAWAWQASPSDQRLVNCQVSPQESVKWLHDRLFSTALDQSSLSQPFLTKSVYLALEAVARQLDHVNSPR